MINMVHIHYFATLYIVTQIYIMPNTMQDICSKEMVSPLSFTAQLCEIKVEKLWSCQTALTLKKYEAHLTRRSSALHLLIIAK